MLLRGKLNFLAVFAGSLWRYSFKISKPSKNVHPKLSAASSGVMQVLFIQNTLILAKKLLNPTHPVQASLRLAWPKNSFAVKHRFKCALALKLDTLKLKTSK